MPDREGKLNLIYLVIGLIFGYSFTIIWQDKHPVAPQIKRVIVERNDTILRIDSVLVEKIKRIKALPDTLVQVEFDTLYRDTGHSDTVHTTIYAERRCLEVTDSLRSCQQKIAVDGVAFEKIDSLNTKEPPLGLKQRLKDIGIGVLIGIGVKSLL